MVAGRRSQGSDPARVFRISPQTGGSCRLLDLARANAGRADSKRLVRSINNHVDATQIGIPAALGDIVCVADVVPVSRTLAANVATHCHPNTSFELRKEVDQKTHYSKKTPIHPCLCRV